MLAEAKRLVKRMDISTALRSAIFKIFIIKNASKVVLLSSRHDKTPRGRNGGKRGGRNVDEDTPPASFTVIKTMLSCGTAKENHQPATLRATHHRRATAVKRDMDKRELTAI